MQDQLNSIRSFMIMERFDVLRPELISHSLLSLFSFFINHSMMSADAWITAIATLVLAVMAVITVNGTYKILPYPRPREPAVGQTQSTLESPDGFPPTLEEWNQMKETVRELALGMAQIAEVLDIITNKA
jgi:hypothetical protein